MFVYHKSVDKNFRVSVGACMCVIADVCELFVCVNLCLCM